MKELMIERRHPSSILVVGCYRSFVGSYQARVVFVSVHTEQKSLKLHPLALSHSYSGSHVLSRALLVLRNIPAGCTVGTKNWFDITIIDFPS